MRSFQICAVFPHLTLPGERTGGAAEAPARRQLRLLAVGDDAAESGRRSDRLLESVNLAGLPRHAAVELPYGRKRALEIATTLALEPELMLLDEPMAGMGHEDIDRTAELIQQGLGQPHDPDGRAQSERRVRPVGQDHGAARGEILAEGPYATVSKNPQVMEAYMGTGHA